jgi:hypothetical protein
MGALAAFFLVMALAEAAGGRSINFVLSGIIVGIAISSMTTVLIVSSEDNRLHGALTWLSLPPVEAAAVVVQHKLRGALGHAGNLGLRVGVSSNVSRESCDGSD